MIQLSISRIASHRISDRYHPKLYFEDLVDLTYWNAERVEDLFLATKDNHKVFWRDFLWSLGAD